MKLYVLPTPDEKLTAEREELIETLEGLLERTRAGEINAFAYCTVSSDAIGAGWEGVSGTRDKVASAVMMLHHRYAAAIMLDADE